MLPFDVFAPVSGALHLGLSMTIVSPSQASAAPHTVPPGLTARWCAPGRPPRVEAPDDLAPRPGGVWWIDTESAVDPGRLLELLQRLHPSLDAGAVTDLLERDREAKAEDRPVLGLRKVSIVGVHPEEDGTESGTHIGGHLVFQMVEALVGDGWIVTCWQPSESCQVAGQTDGAPILRDVTVERVLRDWQDVAGLSSASDVGTLVVQALAHRYKRVPRAIERWLQAWELDFSRAEHEADDIVLRQLLVLVNEARRRLAAFNHSRCLTDNECWFPAPVNLELDKRADNALDRAIHQLRLLFDNVRADMELVNMDQMAQLALEAKVSGEAERRFEKNLGRVTALLLVPTLITGFFGANTRLPGGGSWGGFEVMVALMFVTSVVVYLVMVRSLDRSTDAPRR